MTKAMRDSDGSVRKEVTHLVSSDVNFRSGRFPEYMVGTNNVIIEPEESHEVPSLKNLVAKECSELLEQRRCLTVRDIAKKFEDGLSAAAKLSVEEKWKQVSSLDRQVLLKKLRDILFELKGDAAGQSKEDVNEAISMVEALAVQLTHREGELLHERAEVKKIATFFKQAIEDAKKVVEEERATARREIEFAYAAMERVEKALQEHEINSNNTEKQNKELEELKEEVQEARRIKMLHQPSKVMEMEHELCALRIQLAEKVSCCIELKKELARTKRNEEDIWNFYEFQGSESLGSCLCIVPREDSVPSISNCSIQWYRALPEGSKMEVISGATKECYTPEPFDVGHLLHAEIILGDQRIIVTTTGPIDPAAGLGSFVEELVKMPDTEFKVIVCQLNGYDYPSNSIHVFHVGKLRMKLCQGRTSKARERYSSTMQLCGVRGGGNASAQALFWKAKKGLSFVLAFESDRERNAAIMLARRFAFDCNVMLAGPNDRISNSNGA